MASEIRLTAEWVAMATSGVVVAGDVSRSFAGVSIDTRTLARDDLYIAIRGERFDGADFAQAAIAAGASGAVVPRGRGRALVSDRDAVIIEVTDTTEALQRLGRAVRVEAGAKVVAITGSAGKTTTKEVTAEFLALRYRVTRNRGNLNNHIGVPLSLMELRHRPDVAVIELGMNRAGEISALVRIADPDIRVWTNVGEAHLGFFPSIDAIADAKAEILEGATSVTVLVTNADDERIASRTERFRGRVVTFGVDRAADVRATAIEDRGIDGMRARVVTPRGQFELVTPLIGRGNLANVLAATAVATELDIPVAAIAACARSLQSAAHRGEVLRLSRSIAVIDDSYNANPTAVRRALDVLAQPGQAERRVAVIGEMLELGDRATELHEEIGRAAAGAGVNLLLTIGGAPAAALAEAAVAAGLRRDCVRHFTTSDEAAAALVNLVEPGDLVLVKGSRGVRSDRVVEQLKALLS